MKILHEMTLSELKELRDTINVIINAREQEQEAQKVSKDEEKRYNKVLEEETNYFRKILEEDNNYTTPVEKRNSKTSSR